MLGGAGFFAGALLDAGIASAVEGSATASEDAGRNRKAWAATDSWRIAASRWTGTFRPKDASTRSWRIRAGGPASGSPPNWPDARAAA
jgi:hypothetical protein